MKRDKQENWAHVGVGKSFRIKDEQKIRQRSLLIEKLST